MNCPHCGQTLKSYPRLCEDCSLEQDRFIHTIRLRTDDTTELQGRKVWVDRKKGDEHLEHQRVALPP